MRLVGKALGDYLWYFAGYFLPRLLTLAALSIYTHAVDRSEYGAYGLGVTWVGLATTVLLYWILSALQRLFPERTTKLGVARLFGTAIVLDALLTLGATPLLYLAGRSIGPGFGLPLAIAFVGQGLYLMVHATTIAGRDRRAFMALSCVDAIFKLALGVGALRAGLGVAWALALPAASGVLLFFVQLARLSRRGELKLGIDREDLAAMARFGLPLVGVWLGALLLASLDRFMLEALSSKDELGVYAAAYPLGDASVQVFATPLIATLTTSLFALAEAEGREAARASLRASIGTITSALGATIAISIAAGDPIARVFLGNGYEGAGALIPWISGGLACWVLGSLAAKELELDKRTTANLIPIAVATLINAALNLVTIPRWGALGAAVATLVGYGAYYVAAALTARLPPFATLARSWRALLVAPAAGFAARMITAHAVPPFLRLMLAASLALALYLGALVVVRDPHLAALIAMARRRLNARAAPAEGAGPG
jgi:O-antigen/teichoic acid export membrane protein